MGLLKRHRKKREQEEALMEALSQEPPALNPRQQAEHEALGICEQMMEQSRELEESKKEYKLITNYLNDIQKLEELPREEYKALQDMAQNIVALNQKQDEFRRKKRGISDAQYAQMEQMAEEIPDDIRKLQNNENYQSMVKRDMHNLEGEKSEWNYYLESTLREQKLLKITMAVVLALLVAVTCVLLYLQYGLRMNMTVWILLALLVAVVTGGGCLLRLQGDKKELVRIQASIRRAVTISNQLKAKYVNVTNAVDYACEKFHVTNSLELTYLWEQYLEAVKDREALEKADEDLSYYCRKLVRELKSYEFFDAEIWISQAIALVDKNDMVEIKHALIVRRQKLRNRMEQQVQEIQNLKKQILNLLKEKKEYYKDIVEVLRSIDKMCGV